MLQFPGEDIVARTTKRYSRLVHIETLNKVKVIIPGG